MNKRSISLILNILIVIFELVGFLISYTFNHRVAIEYYTECSNIILLICSSIYIYYLLFNKAISKWLHRLKYLATVCVTITFFVVLFILIPMYNFNFYACLFSGTMLYHHTICPLLGIFTFLFFDNLKLYKKEDIKYSLSFTFIYASVLIPMNILNLIEGPYPFLMVRKQGLILSIVWLVIIFGIAYLIAYLLKTFHVMIHKEILDVYDKDGKVINKTVLRGSSDSEFLEGEHFAVAVIFIENENGEYLIQRLPDESYSSTGGHVLHKETPLKAIIREVKEEIGVKLNKNDIVYLGYKIIDLPIRFLFYTKKNIKLEKTNIDENEVYSLEYMSEKDIKKLIKNKQMKESHAILFKEVLKYKKNIV